MNRRSILSTLCTGALALLAPVVAWARMPKAKPLPDGVVAVTETHLMATYQRERTLTTHNTELRALLAEARDMIYENVMVRRFRIGTGEATYEGYLQDTLAQADLHTRIDAALKGHEHA